MYKYTGRTPVKARAKVDIQLDGSDEWYRASVRDALASQFTVRVRKHTLFYWYKDEGILWRKAR